MITRMNLKNFKCFENLSLPLSHLTLFTGFNAGGKSSVYHGLLMLSQSLLTKRKTSSLVLNGKLVRLGTPGEVLYSKAETKEIVISLEGHHQSIETKIGFEETDFENSLKILAVNFTKENGTVKRFIPDDKKSFSVFQSDLDDNTDFTDLLSSLVYLSAVRGGPLDVYPSPEGPHSVYADVGIEGEFAPWWFYRQLDEEINKTRRHTSEKALTLRRQFNAWAGELFPGAQGNVLPVEKTNLMRLELRISEVDDWLRPANIGYGLSYAFPVLVAGLLAKKEQTLIIDSPEAHLHPLGQSKMGYFLAKMAGAGVQIIVETHSDHVLNGVRLAVMEKAVKPRDVSLHFFIPRHYAKKQGTAQVISPQVNQEGSLSEWPEGFFDQTDKDLERLAGWD